MKQKPRVIVLSGYGLNCEEETRYAFNIAGGDAHIIHVNDLIAQRNVLKDFNILAVPGGFSYGDDTGSGKAYANKLKNYLQDNLEQFAARDTLMIGICNGFQILTNMGFLPGALTFNDSARYIDRWVDIKMEGESPWLGSLEIVSMPIAHGEGKYYAEKSTLKSVAVAGRYTRGEICKYQNLPTNPNGSLKNIAGVLARGGRILGLMPHPERALLFTHLPQWPYLKEKYIRRGRELPTYGPGFQIFKNAVEYFS